jgi:hypothetical protein
LKAGRCPTSRPFATDVWRCGAGMPKSGSVTALTVRFPLFHSNGRQTRCLSKVVSRGLA